MLLLRKSQKQYDQSFILFSDFCVREELIDKPLVIGLDPVEKWEPGTLMLDQDELQKVDPTTALSFVEAMFKNDWYLDDVDGVWKGLPKGGVPTMRPGRPTACGVSNHATWKRHEFGYGPHATVARRFKSIEIATRRLRAVFGDAVRNGLVADNPFADASVVALCGLLRRFMDDEPVFRSDPVEPSVVSRILRFMDLRKAKDACFAFHLVSQLQRGARVCTTNLQVADVTSMRGIY